MSKPGDTQRETVLIVDDEKVVIDLLQRCFEHMGHEALIALSGTEAIEIFREHKEQIAGVVLDLSMPGMSGEEAFDSLVEIDPEIRIILTSGFSEGDSLACFGDRSLAGFIHKPFRPLELVIKARELFGLTPPETTD